jgi:TPR repeat protein
MLLAVGRDTPQDPREALRWLRLAANGANPAVAREARAWLARLGEAPPEPDMAP